MSLSLIHLSFFFCLFLWPFSCYFSVPVSLSFSLCVCLSQLSLCLSLLSFFLSLCFISLFLCISFFLPCLLLSLFSYFSFFLPCLSLSLLLSLSFFLSTCVSLFLWLLISFSGVWPCPSPSLSVFVSRRVPYLFLCDSVWSCPSLHSFTCFLLILLYWTDRHWANFLWLIFLFYFLQERI